MDENKPSRGIAHYYLYADCKTPGCKARLWLSHLEFPDVRLILVNHPEGWFPVTVPCGSCGQVYSIARGTLEHKAHTPQSSARMEANLARFSGEAEGYKLTRPCIFRLPLSFPRFFCRALRQSAAVGPTSFNVPPAAPVAPAAVHGK